MNDKNNQNNCVSDNLMINDILIQRNKHLNDSLPQQKTLQPFTFSKDFTLIYLVNGALTIDTLNSVVELYDQDLYLINCNEPFKLVFDNSMETHIIQYCINYMFLDSVIPNFDDYHFRIDILNNCLLSTKNILDKIYHAHITNSNYKSLKISSLLYNLVYELITQFSFIVGPKQQNDNQFAINVISFIENNYTNKIPLSLISKEFLFTHEYFSRLFQSIFHLSFHKYLTSYRLYKSFDDVINTSLLISNVASIHGFPNTKSFISTFKKHFNSTPLEYRNKFNDINI